MEKLKMLGGLFILTVIPIIGNIVFLIILFIFSFLSPFLKEEDFYRVSDKYWNALAKFEKL